MQYITDIDFKYNFLNENIILAETPSQGSNSWYGIFDEVSSFAQKGQLHMFYFWRFWL